MKIEQLKDLVHGALAKSNCTTTTYMAYGARSGALVASAAVAELNAAMALVKEEVMA